MEDFGDNGLTSLGVMGGLTQLGYPEWPLKWLMCCTVLSRSHRWSFFFQVPLPPGWRRHPGLGCYGFLGSACLHPCSVLCGSDLLTGPTGSAQVDFLLSDELADAVSPGSALHWVLSARTSFYEVRQFVYLVVLKRPRVCLYCGGSGENWVFLHFEQYDLEQVI